MVYVAADGTVRQGERPVKPSFLKSLLQKFCCLDPGRKTVVVVVVAVAWRYWNNHWNNPLAGGKIPAAKSAPAEHWDKIKSDDFFSRHMTEHLVVLGGNRRNRTLEREWKMNPDTPIEIVMDLVDFGGANGHDHEDSRDSSLESMRGTRCSSTRSAITAYFCGAEVAMNKDVALGTKRKKSYAGVRSFAEHIACRHRQGEKNGGNHRRSVYRLGVGCKDDLAGYSHAFSIVAQPDGSFFWLQSYISQYSLQTWMRKADRPDGTPPGQLSLDQLLGKLKKVERLMNIWSWTKQANSDYYELFNVDKEYESLKRKRLPVSATWKPTHALTSFYWDEACVYPLPSLANAAEEDNATTTASAHEPDECNFVRFSNILKETMHSNLSSVSAEGEST